MGSLHLKSGGSLTVRSGATLTEMSGFGGTKSPTERVPSSTAHAAAPATGATQN